MHQNIILIFSILVLNACSSGVPKTLLLPAEISAINATSPSDAENKTAELGVLKAIEDANAFCSKVIGDKEVLSGKRSSRSLWISLGGLVSGSIIAPVLLSANAAANASWIAAFSSAGGAANVANQTIGDAGFSGAEDVKIINDISTKVKTKMDIALNETNTSKARYEAAIEAKNECIYYPRYVYTLTNPK
ncbi:hypothetical protein [Pseudomonas sp. GL-R-19]|uniref:hypothetical protein n=1 Tax=Pseudomonas sp. GL-R-19 TaxID=2832391 RepID=UPI001CBBAA73|nr:hypothetical protein [Pseudomonas sp. GL-R-19]